MSSDEEPTELRFPEQTRTRATEKAYRKKCYQLFRRYLRENGLSEEQNQDDVHFDSLDFVDWVIQLGGSLKPRSFRYYKASVLSRLKKVDNPSEELEMAIEMLVSTSTEHCLKGTSRKTSATKAKSYPPKILDRVIEELLLDREQYKYGTVLVHLLVATIAMGLRPVEWSSAEFVIDGKTGEKALRVRNAKATNGRACGKTREIVYGSLPPTVQQMVEEAATYAKTCDDWAVEYRRIADLHYRVQKKLRPRAVKRYAIYSARHQNIANLKFLADFEDIAPLAGHASRHTAVVHYGRKSAGRTFISARIDSVLSPEALPRPSSKMLDEVAIRGELRRYEDALESEPASPSGP